VLTNGNSKVTPSTPGPEEDDEEPVYEKKMRAEEEMDMTPMVDVTFLLLIFFMVTAAFSLQKAIQVPRQQTDVPSTSVQEEEVEELDMVEVQIDEFGSFLVMAPEWERETPGKQNLISALREAITGNKDGMRLVVKVHELAKLHALVDAMDAGTIAGFSQLEVTQVEEFD
jgi:biopolymer transport protein ExbD